MKLVGRQFANKTGSWIIGRLCSAVCKSADQSAYWQIGQNIYKRMSLRSIDGTKINLTTRCNFFTRWIQCTEHLRHRWGNPYYTRVESVQYAHFQFECMVDETAMEGNAHPVIVVKGEHASTMKCRISSNKMHLMYQRARTLCTCTRIMETRDRGAMEGKKDPKIIINIPYLYFCAFKFCLKWKYAVLAACRTAILFAFNAHMCFLWNALCTRLPITAQSLSLQS